MNIFALFTLAYSSRETECNAPPSLDRARIIFSWLVLCSRRPFYLRAWSDKSRYRLSAHESRRTRRWCQRCKICSCAERCFFLCIQQAKVNNTPLPHFPLRTLFVLPAPLTPPPRPPQKICISTIFSFSWDGCNMPRRNEKQGIYKFFFFFLGGGGAQIRYIMRNAEEAYNHKRNEKLDYTSDPKG